MARFTPALEAFAGAAPALSAAVVDRDERVRLEARRVLENLARVRRILAELSSVIPPIRPLKGKGKTEKKAAAPTRAGKATLVRTSGTAPAPALSPLPVFHLPPPQPEGGKTDLGAVRKNEKLIDGLLGKVGKRLSVTGFTDPNPRARRAALETLEAYGELALEYLPQVVRSLDDPDMFVRWIAARTLARVASAADPGKAPGAATAVPALIRRLDEDDLDPRIAATRALAAYGSQAERAVAALTARVERGDVESRVAMMKALESIGTAAAPALPALARSLDNIDPRVRTEATRVIGRFGTNQKTRPLALRYLADLRRLTTDRDADVRRAAAAAIISITSDTSEK
jgi:HEAT repeat protein